MVEIVIHSQLDRLLDWREKYGRKQPTSNLEAPTLSTKVLSGGQLRSPASEWANLNERDENTTENKNKN